MPTGWKRDLSDARREHRTGPSAPNGATQGLTLAEAIEQAQVQVPGGGELWSYAPGRAEEVVQKIFGPGTDQWPAGASRDRLVWAVAFRVGTDLTTVYVDLLTGSVIDRRDTPGPVPAKHRSEIGFEAPLMHVSNGTTIDVEVWVADQRAALVAPGQMTVDPLPFGPPPWHVAVTTHSGRELLSFELRPENNYGTTGDYPHSTSGDAVRADLSCGRLDVWVGFPMWGPMPPDSFPAHDCDP